VTRVLRFDAGTLQKPRKTSQGYLRVDGWASRVGIQEYRNPDGSIRRELREDSAVFDQDSLLGFEGVPITDDHPSQMVDIHNTKHLTKGTVLSVGRRDGEHVAVSLVITDPDLIKKVESGKRQLSTGYYVELDETPGHHPQFGRYDARQVRVGPVNHLAVVDRGRAGTAAVRMDAAVDVRMDEVSEEIVAQLDAIERRIEALREDWDEDAHPRDENGRFGSGGGGSSKKESSGGKSKASTNHPPMSPPSGAGPYGGDHMADRVEASQDRGGDKVLYKGVMVSKEFAKEREGRDARRAAKHAKENEKASLVRNEREVFKETVGKLSGDQRKEYEALHAEVEKASKEASEHYSQQTFYEGEADGGDRQPISSNDLKSWYGSKKAEGHDVDSDDFEPHPKDNEGRLSFHRTQAEKASAKEYAASKRMNEIRVSRAAADPVGDEHERRRFSKTDMASDLHVAKDMPNSESVMDLNAALVRIQELEAKLDAFEAAAAPVGPKCENCDGALVEGEEHKCAPKMDAADLARLEGERDAARTAAEEAKAELAKVRKDADDAVVAKVRESLDVLSKAVVVLGKDAKVKLDGKDVEMVDAPLRAVKCAVIKHLKGKTVTAEKLDAYVDALFDDAVESFNPGAKSVAAVKAVVVDNGRKDAADPVTPSVDPEKAAADKLKNSISSAWMATDK
jgi:hypothetical protein